MVKAVVKIEQLDSAQVEGSVRDKSLIDGNSGFVRNTPFEESTANRMTFLPSVSNPIARSGAENWETVDKQRWSDSPTNSPGLLYRYRHAWGRDDDYISPPAPGSRWGNLDEYAGVLFYDRTFELNSSVGVRNFKVSSVGDIQDRDTGIESSLSQMSHLGKVEDDGDLELYPFLVTADPEPFSTKNPVNTDVFIRLANYTHTIASGTIQMSLNGQEATPLNIVEFFGGLGGFDVTWQNNQLFEYDEEVIVKVQFDDTAVPANHVVIQYPFYTALDLIGPRVKNLNPANGATGVKVDGELVFDVEDFENAVDINSLKVYANNILIEDGVTGSIQTEELSNERGYTVTVNPTTNWLYGDLVAVAIFVKDTSVHKNETFFGYSFTTESSSAPKVMNPNPSTCRIDEPTTADIAVDIIDGGHGLDKDSIKFTVEETPKDAQITPIIHRDD